MVEMYRRGKQPRLARERLAVLEGALAEPDSRYKTPLELRAQVEEWRAAGRRAFDADRYYDSARTSGYTEHNRGSQEALASRALEFSSFPTASREEPRVGGVLALDLGCGSGLSTGVVSRVSDSWMGAIGVDLSSEMLRAESWSEASALPVPLAGERLRCDLAQPLPFRAGVFDAAYSVAAVHYLAQDSQRRTAADRLRTFACSLRRCLSGTARPCALQAFLTREPTALQLFREAAASGDWALCDLCVDQTYGGKGAEREYLYMLPAAPPLEGASRPPRCGLYRHAGGTCALALEAWAAARGAAPVRIDAAHRAWLEREHERHAKRVVRLQARCSEGAALDHSEPLDAAGAEMARKLEALLAEGKTEAQAGSDAARTSGIIAALHSEA